MKLRKIIAAVLALTVLLTTVPVASAATAVSEVKKAYKGVDLSRWNGEVDFKTLKSRGVEFAILRCYSYGKDKNFDDYYEGAEDFGIDRGAYVFMYAMNKKEAIKEANATIAALEGKALEYPLFLDIEYEKQKSLSRSYLTSICLAELEIFKKAGYEVGIYCSKSFQSDHLDMSKFSDYYLWTAKWSLYSTERDKKKYYFKDMEPYHNSRPEGELWQFTNGGYGPYYGVEAHYLDLNYCYIDFKNKIDSSFSKNPDDYKMPSKTLFYNPSSLVTGEDVAWVQAILHALGYLPGIDGVYGPATKSAVSEFQKNCGLAETGTADGETILYLADVYKHRNFSATIKYDGANDTETFIAAAVPYGTAVTVGLNQKFKNKGSYLKGFTVFRESDSKYLCTDGTWQSESKVINGTYQARVFRNLQKVTISENFLRSEKRTADTYCFTAVWSKQTPPINTVYYNGNVYYIYNSPLSYGEAEQFCLSLGGSLADFKTTEEIKALSVLTGEEKYFIGAKTGQGAYLWSDGTAVTQSVKESESGENSFLTVSAQSLQKPNNFFAVKDESETAGFIMKAICAHDSISGANQKDVLCTSSGYTGDKVCADCGTLIEKGVKIQNSGHNYGTYTVTKRATCGENGVKEKICEICGKAQTKEIPKTEKHTFKTKSVKKATTKESGKAYDRCEVCGLKTKEYTVKKIKSVSLKYTSYAYDGVKLCPPVTVKDKDGKTLINGKDYKLTYKNNKYVGKATVTIKFIGKYGGSVTKTFKIVPKSTKVKSISSKNSSVTLSWSKVSKQSSGYQIAYCTSPKFTKNIKTVKVKSPKELSKTIKSLKKSKTYYFRVRVYKTVDGKNYYSLWSATKKKTVK